MSTVPTYPVRVEGRLDTPISRWLWLVKWVLVIPHAIVLAFLWIAFVVMSIGAFFAIVFTGRYPRAIFDFNLGVLRWSWRVAFYSYSALGTDRYPPFSLGEEPDYPATLQIAYPEHLSPGLALVKWWLLAIPHYLILAFFLGGGWFVVRGTSLIGVLVLIAGVALLFTQRYPRGIFDFVLGLNRWALRVAAYSALMTDAYPPFRLDLGGSEPAAVAMPPAPPAAAPSRPAARGIGAGQIVGAVLASIASLVGVVLVLAGGFTIFVDQTQRDSAGYVMSPADTLTTPGYAITSETVDVPVDGPDNLANDLLGTVRIKSETATPVFLGIARAGDVERYLGGVERSLVKSFGSNEHLRTSGHGAPATQPGEQRFWSAATSGSGAVALDWKVRDGDWVAVVMNESGARGVSADVRIGAELNDLGWIGAGILGGGALLVALGGFGLYLALREPRR